MSFVENIVEFCVKNPILTIVAVVVFLRFAVFRPSTGEIEEYPGNKVRSIKSVDEWREAIAEASKEKKLVIADFYALWCGPCRYAAPIYGKMSTEFDDVVFLKVDVDGVRDVAYENTVRAMPTFVLFKTGKEVDRATGWSESKIRNLINKYRR